MQQCPKWDFFLNPFLYLKLGTIKPIDEELTLSSISPKKWITTFNYILTNTVISKGVHYFIWYAHLGYIYCISYTKTELGVSDYFLILTYCSQPILKRIIFFHTEHEDQQNPELKSLPVTTAYINMVHCRRCPAPPPSVTVCQWQTPPFCSALPANTHRESCFPTTCCAWYGPLCEDYCMSWRWAANKHINNGLNDPCHMLITI